MLLVGPPRAPVLFTVVGSAYRFANTKSDNSTSNELITSTTYLLVIALLVIDRI